MIFFGSCLWISIFYALSRPLVGHITQASDIYQKRKRETEEKGREWEGRGKEREERREGGRTGRKMERKRDMPRTLQSQAVLALE